MVTTHVGTRLQIARGFVYHGSKAKPTFPMRNDVDCVVILLLYT